MDDLSAMLNQILSDPESVKQIQGLASSLGFSGNGGNTNLPQLPAPQQAPQPTQATPAAGGGVDLSALAALLNNYQPQVTAPQAAPQNSGVDLSALSSLLGNLGGQTPQPQNSAPDLSALSSLLGNMGGQTPQPQNSTPDLSALSSLLGNLGGQNPQAQNSAPDLSALSGILGNLTGGKPQGGGADLSALTALLKSGNPPLSAPAQAPGLFPNIDMSTIMKLSQAFASLQTNRANIDLLLALKPRLKDERAKKVDDAIRVMQLIQFLPLIKESGLFGEMDNILGGLGNMIGGNGGGLGSLLGGVGSGIGGLLSNLGLGGRR